MPEVSWSGFAEARSVGENAESRHHRPCIAEEGEINCALFYIATIFLKDPAIQYAGVSDGCGGDGGERNLGELCGWGGDGFIPGFAVSVSPAMTADTANSLPDSASCKHVL